MSSHFHICLQLFFFFSFLGFFFFVWLSCKVILLLFLGVEQHLLPSTDKRGSSRERVRARERAIVSHVLRVPTVAP